jgi:tRNA pseudouridine13 synthase
MAKIRTTPEEFQVDEFYSGDKLIFTEDTALPYQIFKLTKTGWETQALSSNISKKHGIPVDAWGFSGLKDRRSKTTQLVSLPSRYAPKNRISGKDWTLEPHGTFGRHLKSGDHSGNRFSIVVRDIRHRETQLLASRVEQISKIGLPNWFDSQRFGSAAKGKLPGELLMKGDLVGAMKLHLTEPQPSDRSSRRRDRKYLKSIWPDIDRVKIDSIDHQPFRRIIDGWKSSSKSTSHKKSLYESSLSAYLAMPRRLRGLWISAWQSYIWNDVLRNALLENIENHLLRPIDIGVGGPLLYPEAPPGRRGYAKRSLVESLAKRLKEIPESIRMPVPSMVKESKNDDLMVLRMNSNPPNPDTDLDLLKIKMADFSRETVLHPEEVLCTEPVIDDMHGSPKHKRWTCKISFTLPPGSYATNVIRRLFD